MKNLREGVAVCALALMLGCTHSRALRDDIAALRADVDTLTALLEDVSRDLARQHELLRVSRTEQRIGFDNLAHEKSGAADIAGESHARLPGGAPMEAALKMGWDEKVRADSLAASSRLAEAQSLFDLAMADYLAGRREVAMRGFFDVKNRYGDAPRAQDAVYWIGECYYARRNWEEAANTFVGYLKTYPGGAKTCATVFKLGLTYDRLQKTDSRNLMWKKLIEHCPGTEEALVAQDRMRRKN